MLILGDTGPSGTVGPRGPEGLQGIRGIQGEKGEPGKSEACNMSSLMVRHLGNIFQCIRKTADHTGSSPGVSLKIHVGGRWCVETLDNQ